MTHTTNRRFACLALALGMSASAGAHAREWGGHEGHMLFGLLDGVTLTDQQQEQVHAAMRTGFAETKSTRQQLHALEGEVSAAMLASGTVSSASITPLIQQEEQLKAALDQERVAVALQVRQILTASQLAQAAQAHSQLTSLHEQEQAIAHPAASGE